jgi:DNA topoisomerase VI subunit B
MKAMKQTTNLARTTFETSRLLEFFSEKELQMQIGHPKDAWLIALAKELIDNGLDACETANVAPEIEVVVESNSIAVQDNGPRVAGKNTQAIAGLPGQSERQSVLHFTDAGTAR